MTVINLNKARKARDKAQAKSQAAENRVRFGQAKADKARLKAERKLAEDRLSGHERED